MFKEFCKQYRQVMFKGTMAKWPVQKQSHRTAQNMQNTKTQQTFRINDIFVFFGVSIFLNIYLCFLKLFLQKILNYRLGMVNDFHWGLKHVFLYSTPHTYSTFIWEKTDNQIHLLLYPDHQKHEYKCLRKVHI